MTTNARLLEIAAQEKRELEIELRKRKLEREQEAIAARKERARESRQKRKESQKLYAKRYWIENREELRRLGKLRYQKNKSRLRQAQNEKRAQMSKSFRSERDRVYRARRSEEVKQKDRVRATKMRDSLSDAYIRQHWGKGLTVSPEWIAAKRAILMVKRLIRERETA